MTSTMAPDRTEGASYARGVLVGPNLRPDPGLIAQALLAGEKAYIVSDDAYLTEHGPSLQPYLESLIEADLVALIPLRVLEADRRAQISRQVKNWLNQQSSEDGLVESQWIMRAKLGEWADDLPGLVDVQSASEFPKARLQPQQLVKGPKGYVSLLLWQGAAHLAEQEGLVPALDPKYAARFIKATAPPVDLLLPEPSETLAIYQDRAVLGIKKVRSGVLGKVAQIRQDNQRLFRLYFAAMDAWKVDKQNPELIQQRQQYEAELLQRNKLLTFGTATLLTPAATFGALQFAPDIVGHVATINDIMSSGVTDIPTAAGGIGLLTVLCLFAKEQFLGQGRHALVAGHLQATRLPAQPQ